MSEEARPALRERWDSRTAFLFAAMGSAVGLGNLWRFPYIAGKHGGGAFLIPYFIALLTAGIPLLILECGIGQMLQRGAPEALGRIRKGFEWVGWWALAVGSMISFYYAAVMAWCWGYLWYSLRALVTGTQVPWATGPGEFFFQTVLQRNKNPWEFGGLSLPVVLGLVVTWVAIFLIIHRGLKVVSKVVMVTVPLPVILLAILLVRGLTLEGAEGGLAYYLTPRFEVLKNPQVWLDAYGQIFFSLSLGFGIMIAYASYQPRASDVNNDAFIISLGNCGTSFFAGFVVFSTLGYLAAAKGVALADVAKAGPGLAFVAYPEAIARMPWAPLVGVLFFLALLTLGIDSLFSIVEAIITGIHDKWPVGRDRITAVFCGVGLVLGLLYATHSGLSWLDIVDKWMNSFGLAAVGLAECIVVGWLYKTGKLRRWLNSVSEVRIGLWWEICVKVITPLVLIVTLVMAFVQLMQEPYEGYPQSALIVGGWGVAIGVIVIGVLLARIPGKVAPAESPEAEPPGESEGK